MMSFLSNELQSSPWRPAVSSPLTSSPIRPSSPQSPNKHQRDIQSSPIRPLKFKYACRPSRPNPVIRRREDAQEQRRLHFLQSVRDKANDKAWQRRDIEGQFLKANWLEQMGRLSHDAPAFSEADIEEAMAYLQEVAQPLNMDDMLEAIREEDEVANLVSSYEEQPQQEPALPAEDEYDDIFAELISREPPRQDQPSSSNQMDMSE